MIDRLIHGAIAVWFAILAVIVAFSVGTTLAGDKPLTELDYAGLVSRSCSLLFLVMMAYLIVIRANPKATSSGWQPRISALVGTNLVTVGVFVLTPRTDLNISQHLLSASLILAGNGLCIYVLSHLGHSFSVLAEARKFVADGPYGIVRHPLYLAEEIAILGIFIQFASMGAAILVAVHFGFQLMRMLNEERLLSETFPEYPIYMAGTARLLPGIW